jgi:phosphoribosyl-ATP pyrophosphohydrolase/phosphoribosyl-AMP cyclohydrolase
MLKFDDRGLIPVIVQDALSGRVLMFAWMNAETLAMTRAQGEAVFWSRSRGEIWRKGATSGNTLKVRELRADCDGDVLLMRVDPAGPACHTGEISCFWQDLDAPAGEISAPPSANFLDQLESVVADRRAHAPAGSYTASLFAKGRHKIAQKVGEEGLETAMAGVAQDDARLIDESADLLFHLLVLLNERDVPLTRVLAQLMQRHVSSTGH